MTDLAALERAVEGKREALRWSLSVEHNELCDALIAAVVALERARHPMQVANAVLPDVVEQ